MSLQLIVLGSSSAIPAHNRGLSAQVVQARDKNYLIDCGEGTQFRVISQRIKLSRLQQVFISHLHGDHIFGLPGLLGTLTMQQRKKPLDIFAPTGLSGLIGEVMDVSSTHLNFPLNIHRVDTTVYRKIFTDENFDVYSIPLDHRVAACGFKFVQRPSRNIKQESIRKFGLDFNQIRRLKDGKSVELESGVTLDPDEHTFQKNQPRSFAYISDTAYDPGILPYIRGVDTLFHEATYLDELRELARERKHSTARQAALMAKKAGVGRLIIGHFSSRYKNLTPLANEARSVFPESFLGQDGKRFTL